MTGGGDHHGWISHLGVNGDFRRWGIGRKLVQACEDWLAEHNVLESQVTVPDEGGPAAKFLEDTGYEEDTNRVFRRRLQSRTA